MLQFLNNLWWTFIFSNYIEIDHFKLDLLKRSDLNAGLWSIRKKTIMNESLNV